MLRISSKIKSLGEILTATDKDDDGILPLALLCKIFALWPVIAVASAELTVIVVVA